LLLSLGVLAVGATLYFLWDNWWVNWDGGFYLYLGQSLRRGEGLTLPDGSLATFRGPGYPGLFALGWTVLDVSAKTAIWLSRAVLLSTGVVVTYVVSRKGSLIAGALAGLAAIVPALVLESGGWYFVPDGLASALILGSIAVVLTERIPSGVGSTLVVGVLCGAAVLSKETAVLYIPVVLLLLWVRLGQDQKAVSRGLGVFLIALSATIGAWLVWLVAVEGTDVRPAGLSLQIAILAVAVAAITGVVLMWIGGTTRYRLPPIWVAGLVAVPILIVGSAGVLWFVGEPTVMSASAGLGEAAERTVFFFGWSWLPASILLVVALVVGRGLEPRLGLFWLAGLGLIAVGLGQIWYSGAAALSPRNGVGAVTGLAIVIGVLISDGWTREPRTGLRWSKWGVVVVSVAFVGVSAWSTNRLDSQRPLDGRNWDNEAVMELESWLADAPTEEVLTTPIYATYLYFLNRELPAPTLVNWYFSHQDEGSYAVSDFCTRIWWAGDLQGCPQSSEVRVIQGNRRILSLLFGDALGDGESPLIVTGTTPSASAFNGMGLLYLIEEYDLGQPLFATSEAHLPNWAVVYDIDWERWNSASIPALSDALVEGLDGIVEEPLPIDPKEALQVLVEVLPP
jgi:hypothetical protein